MHLQPFSSPFYDAVRLDSGGTNPLKSSKVGEFRGLRECAIQREMAVIVNSWEHYLVSI